MVDALVGDKGLLETMRARRQYRDLAVDLAQKRQENARLRDDPKQIESVAREELGLMREGEVLFIVHDVK